jgi:hypothetical protein
LIHQLRTLLADPIPPEIWKSNPKAFSIDATFTFDLVRPESIVGATVGPQPGPTADPTKFSDNDSDGGMKSEKGLQTAPGVQGMYGLKFFFYRAILGSKLDWKLGPLAGYGIMPAIGIDPSWFVDKITDAIHHRGPIDPLLKYREDIDW